MTAPCQQRRFHAAAAAQPALVLGILAGVVLAPPERGRMLLIPESPAIARALPATAIAHGALLIGTGPWRGTLVVESARAGLAGRLIAHGVIAVSARAGGCTGRAETIA